MLSNSLTDMADRVATANAEFVAASRTAFDRALLVGGLLLDAKADCQHGDWLPFLRRAEVAERHAQRLMAIARAGIKSDMVTDLGGVSAALRFLSSARLPDASELLIIYHDNFDRDGRPLDGDGSVALVHPDADPKWLFVDGYDIGASYGASVTSRKPMSREVIREASGARTSLVWHAVHNIMAAQLSSVAAVVVPVAGWRGWVREFDGLRGAA